MNKGEQVFHRVMIENFSKLKKVESPLIEKSHIMPNRMDWVGGS